MTRHGGGSFGGGGVGGPGGGGGGGGFGSHGRSSGGSFGPPPPPGHRHPPPPPPHHSHHPREFYPGSYYVPPPVLYSGFPRPGVGVMRPGVQPGYQTIPPDVVVRYDRRTELLNRSKSCFTFLLIALFIVMVWMYFGLYESTHIHLGVHDSRLVHARPFSVQSLNLKNRYEVDGPIFHEFNSKPPLNRESSWLDSQNRTFHYGHEEMFYWMNKGSTVKIDYKVDKNQRITEPVYLAVIRNNADDLRSYYERPDHGSISLLWNGVFYFDADKDADYAFSLATYNRKDVTVHLDSHFHTRHYSPDSAIQHNKLITKAAMTLSIFRSKYGLLEGPGVDKNGVDNWDIELSYGIRWSAVILLYGLLTLVYLWTKASIMASIHELDPALPEYAPLLTPPPTSRETQVAAAAAAVAPSAPVLPASILEEEQVEKEVQEDQLCSVCLDAQKDAFFVPCGHRATCYDCGLRILKSDAPNCPICRQPIGEVKRIYDA